MLNYIYGEITELVSGKVTVDVNGVGFELQVSENTLTECKLSQKIRLYTYMQVKEDGIALFGFASLEEKNMFLQLISVSGIGCKVALSVLSGMSIDKLVDAIVRGDAKQISKIKGLGNKTAERLVLELKEKIVAKFSPVALSTGQNLDLQTNKNVRDAVAVLCSLGKSQADAEMLVDAALKLGAISTEELVSMAFKIK